MTASDLLTLYDCGWANKRLFEVLSNIPAGEFTRPVAGSYGSIRNTLVHVMSAEWGWLDRCGGHHRGAALKAEDFPDLETLIAQWHRVEGWVREFLSSLADESLDRSATFKLGDGPEQTMPLGELLHHGAVHGVHHRGQVAPMLRELRHTPGTFDILILTRLSTHPSNGR
jgi:uncharacterized damage-inducible protein DinB